MTTKRRRRQRIRLRPAAVILILIAAVAVVVALTAGGKRDVKATAQGETPQPAAPATEVVAETAEPTRLAALVTIEPTTGDIYQETEDAPEPTFYPDDGLEQHGSFLCTAEDYEWLLKCVQAEQGDFSNRASYLTACCIINRSMVYDMTFTDVIFQKNQFEVVANGRIYDAEPSAQTIAAVEDALLHPETWVLAVAVGHLHDSWATPVEEIETPWGTTEVFYASKY